MTDEENEEALRFVQIMPAVGIWAVFDAGKELWKQRVHGWGLEKCGGIKPLIPEYEGFMWNADEEPSFVCLIGDEDLAEHMPCRLEDIPLVASHLEVRRRRALKKAGAGT